MATRRSRPSPEHDERQKRKPGQPLEVHIDPVEQGWAVRVGDRVEATFATRLEAVQAAMPRARKLRAKLLLHVPDGRSWYLATSKADELMLELWKRTHEQDAPQPAD